MKETDLLNAWLWEKHRTDVQWRRIRLGVMPTKELARMYSVIMRWADAIVLKDGVVLIIEAKVRPKPEPIAQLELYKKLFLQTPEFSAYKNWPIRLILLTSTLDLNIVEFCSEKDIEYEMFTIDDVNRTRAKNLQHVLIE